MDMAATTIWAIVAIYFLISMLLVAAIPSFIVRPTAQKTPLGEKATLGKTDLDVLDLKNKVRQTVIQICGGVGFLFSVYMAISAQTLAIGVQTSSNNDLKAKYDRETAELFVKAVESKSPEALYALTYVAQRDPTNYHETVYGILSSLIRSFPAEKCQDSSATTDLAAARGRVSLRLLHERPVSSDRQGTHYNIEHSCLDGSDISVEKAEWGRFRGLAGVRASGSSMLRINFTKTELQKAEFMGIAAGDVHNPGWEQEPHHLELNDLDDKGSPKWKAERRKFIAHFIDANLTDALFNGAGLEGADFSGATLTGAVFEGANISRTSFRGAQGLTADQLLAACVDDEKSQPFLNGPLAEQISRRQGVPICK
jgi:uncharacterized protein YjbI with pentapeptide repeats